MQNTFNIHCWILYCSWNAQAYNKIQIKSLHYLSIYFQNVPIQSYIEINSASKYSESSKILNKAFKYIETFLVLPIEIQIVWFLAFQQRIRNQREYKQRKRDLTKF